MANSDDNTTHLIEDAKRKFNQYADGQKNFQPPLAHIDIDIDSDGAASVHMEVQYKDVQYRFESVQEKDVQDIYQYLNSQPLVRAKYADGQTSSLKATIARVETFVDRFQNRYCPLYLYSGFVVSDAQTETFLGLVNLGSGPMPATAEMAFLNRSDCWSRPPETISGYADTSVKSPGSRLYSGVGTAEACAIIQYATRLKQEGYTINGLLPEAVVGTARLDNEGSWKSLSKAGMTLSHIDVTEDYGKHLRYQLQKSI
ncbi:unnamed protein product [Adineta ricciae]|uniref:Uncharacterized protein n=1 Tax=Adineta ricciae TaxID=249248 RepID=A0A815YYL2_ADIRI|nr:unnamed protein product [Adineta ricciae]CAF1576965.1 unnamed protein product [Adineta ricciae]